MHLHGALGWLSGNDSLADECKVLAVPPTHSMMWLLPFPLRALIFCCLERWSAQQLLWGLCLEGVAACQPTACCLCCEIEAVNSGSFSGKWEQFLCCQWGLLPEGTTRLQRVDGFASGCIQHTYSSDMCELVHITGNLRMLSWEPTPLCFATWLCGVCTSLDFVNFVCVVCLLFSTASGWGIAAD